MSLDTIAAYYGLTVGISAAGAFLLVPTIVAKLLSRDVRRVFGFNVLFGWMPIGWVLVLVMACRPDPVAKASYKTIRRAVPTSAEMPHQQL